MTDVQTNPMPEAVRSLAEGKSRAHVATLMADGSPHSVPVWLGVEGDCLAFLTGPESIKARNLAADTRVAISLTDGDNPFAMAAVRGEVVARVTEDAAWEIADRVAMKYIGQPYPREQERVVFLVRVHTAFAQEFA